MLKKYWYLFAISMLPIVELRGGIPFGVALGLPYPVAFTAAVIGNILPAPFIIVYIRRIFQWMRRRLPRLDGLVDRLEKNGEGLNLTWEVRNGILCHTKGQNAATLEGQVVRLADHIAYINHDIDDAIRGGIIYQMDIPLELQQELGFSHGERINTLTTDAIAASQDGEGVRLSSTRKKALADLRAFMFQAVYCNPVAKGEESKAQAMLELLFRHYIDHLDELPGDYYAIAQAEGPERAVCDYLAGMTDSYAVDRYGDVFIPKAWTVK